jgi:hypothetical protein
MKKLLLTILTILSLLTPSLVRASSFDFHIESNLQISYKNGNDFVTVQIEYIREVNNSGYYFSASGDKTFSIPDLKSQSKAQIDAERDFKKESVTVKDSSGKNIYYKIEEDDDGIDVVVPNYKQTTKNSPYKIYITYNTHDYVEVVNQNVVIQAPSLPKDTEFEIRDEDTGTTAEVEYNLEILVSKDVDQLAKIWPSGYTFNETDNWDIYEFPAQVRLGINPYLEFGTSQIYKFELEYITPKTDTVIPENSPEILNALSTNIFELSLPRYFDETDQKVKIESISPTPTKIEQDDEGNIIATFEVGANRKDSISVTGYVWVQQDPYDSRREIPNPSLEEYSSTISQDENLQKYLRETKYWQVNDSYIQGEANRLKENNDKVLDLIKSDYQYINEKLEYDQSKASSTNDRIGAKQALQGESSVCMEYADAMITILRAQGIASRAAIGYSNLEDASDTPESQVRHQWVQVWLPGYGWLSVDPTFESKNMDIGPNIHKLLWETFSGDELSNTKIYSADSLDNGSNIEFNISIYAVQEEDIENMENLKTYEEILPIQTKNDKSEFSDWLNKFIKASTIGKSVAVVLPVLLLLSVLIILIGIIKAILKGRKSKNPN